MVDHQLNPIYLQFYKNNNRGMDFIQLWQHILDTDNDFSFNHPTITSRNKNNQQAEL